MAMPSPLILAAAALAAQGASGSLHETVANATFELCLRAASGEMRLSDSQAIAALGYIRASPEMEATAAAAAQLPGRPLVAHKGSGDDLVVVMHWPQVDVCSITFGGPEADAAIEGIRARVRASARVYRPSSEPITHPLANVEAFDSEQNGRRFVLALTTPRSSDSQVDYSIIIRLQEN